MSHESLTSRTAMRYAAYGALFGLCFPVGAAAFLWATGGLAMPSAHSGWLDGVAATVAAAQRRDSLFGLVATAPLFLGWFAHLAGVRQDRIARLNASLRAEAAERSVALETLGRSEARFRAVFDHAAIGIVVHDLNGVAVEVNPAFAKLLAYAPEELRGRQIASLSPADDAGVTRAPVRELVAGSRDRVEVEKRFVRKDGELLWGELTISRLENADGAVAGLVGMVHDVTARKALEAELTRQAFHDPLTGLANRARFRDGVERALGRVTHGGDAADAVAVLFVDLDDFKRINDSFGHAEGDRLLLVVAERLLQATRGSDAVARLGGDEFAVLLGALRAPEEAAIVAERVLEALSRPVALGGAEVVTGASVGVATSTHARSADALLRNADLAMYHAKQRLGKGRYALFTPAMHATVLLRVQLEGELRRALERGEMTLEYQPIVRLETGAIVGAEALVRWRHPERGTVAPGAFIAIAEETGLIVPLGRWVLEEAGRQAAVWRELLVDAGCEEEALALTVSVNVSGRQLEEPAFVDEVRAALEGAGLAPWHLVLELTESLLVRHSAATLDTLRALKALGVRLAVDDFGTGYSSLAYLQRFPVDIVKIDRSFVNRAGSADPAIARAIVALGAALRLTTVAEGVEQAEQAQSLRALGCEYAQGYYFAAPMTAEELTPRLLAAAGALAT